MNYDPVRLEVYKHLLASIADEMGIVLRRASYSPNIKERRDFSCAVFDAQGRMVAQAAHIPVHLGSMPLSVAAAIRKFSTGRERMLPDDVIILNDPYQGGTHLPDITLVSPVFLPKGEELFGFVASRAHHADVGGMSPGSMPLAREIYQEGLIIPPVKLYESGQINNQILDLLLANVRTPQERAGDLLAQAAANQRGVLRLHEIVQRYSTHEVARYMQALLDYAERTTRSFLNTVPDGIYTFEDFLDDDGINRDLVPIRVRITIEGDHALVDFSGSAPQQQGNINAVYAITLSAVFYAFRCLIPEDVPNNAGCLAPVQVIMPAGSVVNANSPAPVAGGNVETSQRIVDVLFGALSQALPDRVPAASQGTMNNITIGGWDPVRNRPFTYYETMAGGMGARPDSDGPSAIHSHMTNTLNTPAEAIEYSYPLRILRYEIRRNSGGAGRFNGGDGLRRDIQLLAGARVTLLSDRRRLAPYGLQGGASGLPGENVLLRGGIEQRLPGKCEITLNEGDILSLRSPGGGGFGETVGATEKA